MSHNHPAEKARVRHIRQRGFWKSLAVIMLWFAISGVVGPLFGQLSTVQKNDNSSFLPRSAESTKVVALTPAFRGTNENQLPVLILLESADGSTIDAGKIATVNAFLATLPTQVIPESKQPLSTYLLPGAVISAFPSPDGKALLASLPIDFKVATQTFSNKEPELPVIVKFIREEIKGVAETTKTQSYLTGVGAILADLFGAFSGIDSTLLLVTGGIVALILIFVYRSPFLWVLPLFTAVTALSLAGGIVYLLAKKGVIDLSGQSQGILSVLVLGAATDYALLLIARYREELHLHDSPFAAMRVAWRGVVEPIVASGLTVITALLVLLFSDLSSNRGLGPVGAIGIAASMVTVLTLLPALLLCFARWIFWPKVPRHDEIDEKLSGLWSRVGERIARSPRRTWLISGGSLLVLAAFSSTLSASGLSTLESFTKKPQSVVGQSRLLEHFPAGSGQPTEVIAPVEVAQQTKSALLTIPGVSQVTIVSRPGSTDGQPYVINGNVLLDVTLALSPDSVRARDLIPIIRKQVQGVDSRILVGGSSAINHDTDAAAKRDIRVIIPIVLFVILIILTLLLRSILAGAILLVTVILSYLATLGVSALVFHHLFHFAGEDTSFPLFAFVFLVALGIDYNIFLMTRVREESVKLGTRKGVIKGVTVTGGVITSAGVVLAATFAVLGVLPLVFLAELGFAVSFGVLLDTLLVRSLLVPALVHNIGSKIWWPSSLAQQKVDSD